MGKRRKGLGFKAEGVDALHDAAIDIFDQLPRGITANFVAEAVFFYAHMLQQRKIGAPFVEFFSQDGVRKRPEKIKLMPFYDTSEPTTTKDLVFGNAQKTKDDMEAIQFVFAEKPPSSFPVAAPPPLEAPVQEEPPFQSFPPTARVEPIPPAPTPVVAPPPVVKAKPSGVKNSAMGALYNNLPESDELKGTHLTEEEQASIAAKLLGI